MQRHDREHHAVFREMATIAYDDITDVTDSLAVDKNFAHLNRFGLLRAMGSQLQHIAVFEDKTIVRRYADILGELPMAHEMAIFAVNRHEITGPGEMEHSFQFFLARVTGHMDLGTFS